MKQNQAPIGTHFDLSRVYFGIVPTRASNGGMTFDLSAYGLFYHNPDGTYTSYECFGEGSFEFTDDPENLPIGVFREVYYVVPFTIFGTKDDIFEVRRNQKWILAMPVQAINGKYPEKDYLAWKDKLSF